MAACNFAKVDVRVRFSLLLPLKIKLYFYGFKIVFSLHGSLFIDMIKISVNCKNCGMEFQKPLSYIKQGHKRGYTNHFCSNKCSCEYNKNINVNVIPKKRRDSYDKNPKKCKNCELIIPFEKKNDNENYCSIRCSAFYTQKDGGRQWTEKAKQKMSTWAKQYAHKPNPKNRIKKECETCKKEFEVIPSLKDRNCCSRQCKNEWIKKTDYLKNKGLGGYRINSGTSKRGWYKGYFCGSSWELAWVIYNLEHDIQFKRNTDSFEYTYNGTIKKYYPDFKIDDVYIEIKGYHSKQFDAKQLQFPHKLKVFHKLELKEILKYVKDKYGKNFTYLYGK